MSQVDAAKVWIRFCMRAAYEAGLKRHPAVEISEAYPDACDYEPQSIVDAWFFRAVPKAGEQPPGFSLAPRYVGLDEVDP